jgi:hypothetical protein
MEKPTEEIVEAMSVDDLLANMAAISSGYQSEREALGVASADYHKKQRKVRLYIAFGDYGQLKNPETVEYAKEVKTKKLLADDIKALIELECEKEYTTYQDLKHACATSEVAFEMFAKQLSWHQTVRRSEGNHDQMVRETERQYR